MMANRALFVGALYLQVALAQLDPAALHMTGFNSSFILSQAQIDAAQLDDGLVQNIQITMDFDITQMAYGGPHEDDFYTLPPLDNATALATGQLLKVQRFTDPTGFAIPPNTALSRIMYTTVDANGTIVPTSGFILWPFAPRKAAGSDCSTQTNSKLSTVVWTHGTSGFFEPQSPSTHRYLWYGNSGPFALALAGHAVFAPDYAGLGIVKSWDGSEIQHQYHISATTAGDALYGFRAARTAFPEILDEQFVVMGHSQGGGVAWGVAEVLARDEEEFADLAAGYRGAIPCSPTTDVLNGSPVFMITTVSLMLQSIFPDFQLEDWLTPLGAARAKLGKEIGAGIAVLMQLFMSSDGIVRPDYDESWYAGVYSKLANAGRKPFKGPMLVVQGTTDSFVTYNVTASAVKDTCGTYPDSDLDFLVVSGSGHVPVLDATRHLWLKWIADRFDNKPLHKKGCIRTELTSLLPIEQYQHTVTSYPLWANLPEYGYENPLSV